MRLMLLATLLTVGCSSFQEERLPVVYSYAPFSNDYPGELQTLDVTQAEAEWRRQQHADPGPRSDALKTLAWKHATIDNDYDHALDEMTQAIQLHEEHLLQQAGPPTETDRRSHAELYARRGILHWTRKEHQQARTDYSQAIELDPGNWEYYFHRWMAHQYFEDDAAAEADYSRGLKLKPDVFEQHWNAGPTINKPYRVHGGVI